ncbi:hypothetical protein H6F67_11385 [Microcoleus sp. FACHB-1515]|uniref:hypothetical protein n=1 Tax=Microcoleus sp. FACHB-1515 TaxID=2692821 RepID=UPI001684C1B3|nr:hypothetical protein [Microcoleus sp. FACHB-1515]MBD2090458.1 hypothetical protein [Microcoleus sp. FACHB-1515]
MMNTPISEQEILDFLTGIEEGKIILIPKHEPQHIYAGNVSYRASNNWTIVIFNDANEWDYIDCIKTDNGRKIDFNQIELLPVVGKYYPSAEVSWTRYGIPGYCKFRCTKCGSLIQASKESIYICQQCERSPSSRNLNIL